MLDMPDPNTAVGHEDPQDVEPVGDARTTVAGHPDAGRSTQLLLFPPVDRSDRIAEPVTPPRLDLDEGNDSVPPDDQVDVPVPGPEAASHHPPPPDREPPLRDPLSQLPECLPGR